MVVKSLPRLHHSAGFFVLFCFPGALSDVLEKRVLLTTVSLAVLNALDADSD